MTASFEKVKNIKELASLASSIWHEYWTCILSPEQIDYMVENFQSEHAIKNQIENENYTYYFIVSDGEKAGYFGISNKKEYLFLSKLYIKKEYRNQGLGKKHLKNQTIVTAQPHTSNSKQIQYKHNKSL
ncbi:MAG: GNAT family N-acetyltransferase [Candidatus Gastranaerophilaceae bacterium]